MILRRWLWTIFACLTTGRSLKCSSYLESHKNSSIRDIRLAVGRTLCLRAESEPSKIYAISILDVWTQWAIASKQDFVLADFHPKQCFCDCRRGSSVCEKQKLHRECPDCLPLIQSHPIGFGCDSNTEATSCCNIQAINTSNISIMHLSHAALFYRLEVSRWNETIAHQRSLHLSDVIELSTEGRHRLTVDGILLELHAATKHHYPFEREVILDEHSKKIIPLLHSHRCIDALKLSPDGSLQVRDPNCLPSIQLDNCSDQRLIVEEGKPHFVDFSHGSSVSLSQDGRHLSLPAHLMITITIDDKKNSLKPVEDDSRIDGLKDVRIEVDSLSRRRFHAFLQGAQGTLHFTFITMSLSARYSAQYSVPSTESLESSHEISLPLPASIREDATVCVRPLDDNETQLCAHAPYKEIKITTWELLKPSIFVGSCDECVGATSIIDRITAAVGLLIPAKSISRLFNGEPLHWNDVQSLILSTLLLASLILSCVLFKRIIVPIIDCCLCICSPISFPSRMRENARKRQRYSAVAPAQDSQA